MKIQFKVASFGIAAGDVVDVEDSHAKYLVENGHATQVEVVDAPKTVTVKPVVKPVEPA